MNKNLKDKVVQCCSNIKPEQKKILYYASGGFLVGLILGVFIGRRR